MYKLPHILIKFCLFGLIVLIVSEESFAFCESEWTAYYTENFSYQPSYKMEEERLENEKYRLMAEKEARSGMESAAYLYNELNNWRNSVANKPSSTINRYRLCVAEYLFSVAPGASAYQGAKSAKGDGQLESRQLRKQNESSGQQEAQTSQQLAQATQAKADQERQGKRKTHDPAAEAHQCIKIDPNPSGNFGAFINGCGYKVNFVTCNYRPRNTQGGFNWADSANCEKNGIGLHTPGAGASVAAHNRGTEKVYWFACKAPASPTDARFVAGSGITARCY
jgi:hypothetical protein